MNDEALTTALLEIKNQNAAIIAKLNDVPSRSEFKSVEDRVVRNTAWIEGNGTAGAKTRLTLVEGKVADLAQDISRDILVNIVKTIGVPVLITGLIWTIGVLVAASRLMPLMNQAVN